MALFYYSKFKERTGVENFGDDINPALLGRFIKKSILSSDKICLFGIGTILHDKNLNDNQHFHRKVIFSSGVGYGNLTKKLDESWDIACVRGPKSAEALGVGLEKSVCDGAILLSDVYKKPTVRRSRGLFVPHVSSHISAGFLLKDIVESLGLDYLPPICSSDEFIEKVTGAPFLVTEAMHGAILADSMRVPWIPIGFHEFLEFKWNDWMESVGLNEGRVHPISPKCWDENPKTQPVSATKRLYREGKAYFLKQKLRSIIATQEPLLSAPGIIDEKKHVLLNVVNEINNRYS